MRKDADGLSRFSSIEFCFFASLQRATTMLPAVSLISLASRTLSG